MKKVIAFQDIEDTMKYGINKKNNDIFRHIMDMDTGDFDSLRLLLNHNIIFDVKDAYNQESIIPPPTQGGYDSIHLIVRAGGQTYI